MESLRFKLSTSTLLSEFCTVKVLVGLENLSTLQNSEVSAFGTG